MSTGDSNTNKPHKFVFNLPRKLDLKCSNKQFIAHGTI